MKKRLPYFAFKQKGNKPMDKPLIHIPANYTVTISVLFDPKTGQSELQIRNTLGIPQPVSMMQVGMILMEHGWEMIKGLVKDGKVNISPVAGEKTNA